jgi:hypothetical protein
MSWSIVTVGLTLVMVSGLWFIHTTPMTHVALALTTTGYLRIFHLILVSQLLSCLSIHPLKHSLNPGMDFG